MIDTDIFVKMPDGKWIIKYAYDKLNAARKSAETFIPPIQMIDRAMCYSLTIEDHVIILSGCPVKFTYHSLRVSILVYPN